MLQEKHIPLLCSVRAQFISVLTLENIATTRLAFQRSSVLNSPCPWMLGLAPSFSRLLPAPVPLSVLLPPAPSLSHQAGIYFCVSASAAFHSRCTWWEDPDNNGDHCDEPRSHCQPHAQESQDNQEESAGTGQATATGRLLRVGLLSFWPLLCPLVSLFREVSVCHPPPFSLHLLLFTWCVIFFHSGMIILLCAKWLFWLFCFA